MISELDFAQKIIKKALLDQKLCQIEVWSTPTFLVIFDVITYSRDHTTNTACPRDLGPKSDFDILKKKASFNGHMMSANVIEVSWGPKETNSRLQ